MHRTLRHCAGLFALVSSLAAVAVPALAAQPTLAACDAGIETVLAAAPGPAPEARAVWLDGRHLRWPGVAPVGRFSLVHSREGRLQATPGQAVAGADTALALSPRDQPLPAALAQRFKWVGAGVTLSVQDTNVARLRELQRGQWWVVREDDQGRVLQASGLQVAGALDDLFASAGAVPELGATVSRQRTQFRLWAPTAQAVWLCLHADGQAPAQQLQPLRRDSRSGVWSIAHPRDLSGHYYTYLVDVLVPGVGLVRNRVTDPYALSLSANSQRTWIGRLDHPDLQPAGWDTTPRPPLLKAATDAVIYELHVRDFSASDTSVRAAWRGKYLAFTEADSLGMRHLRAMAAAGLTDVHLLPIFDLATVPEAGCTSPDPAALAQAAADSPDQQALVMAGAARDCFNWGYDPWHFNAPEGSFATRADDGAVRIRELRQMVQALHAAGLRVGMDVVYNHTSASGQVERSVLDRIVPGYYQRLNASGQVETSTCCANTATENRMMARLMIDSAVVWARDHRIDSFRFDLMGHQPRAAMERLQKAVNAATGRHIHLIGEGWNFGEVKDGARFVQASQAGLPGSGIASFSDRGRDAARGGGCCDNAQDTPLRQGWLNGLFYAPQPGSSATRQDLLRTADLVRVGLAGTLAGYRLQTHDGTMRRLDQIDYAGQPAGFAHEPGEVVNYVENHDNQTLFDIHALKLPRGTSSEDRARVQVLGLALTAFSQGIAYYHAGVEMLRSKSGDRNSFDSGDWFNRLDWRFEDNHWGSGLPPKQENADFWPLLQPLLADPALKPTPAQIRFTRDAFLDLLKIRASSTLWRLPTAQAVSERLRLLNTGPEQIPTLMVGHLQGQGLPGAGFAELLYFVNSDLQPAQLSLPGLQGRAFMLHPVHRSPAAADPRPAQESSWDAATAIVRVPPRTAMVYVLPAPRLPAPYSEASHRR
jgi:pullulanase/glycogen debranching enzyme